MTEDHRAENGKVETAAILRELLDRSTEERVRERAYELYVQRGKRDGNAERDWYDAQEELLAFR
jgi:hypothetical protein